MGPTSPPPRAKLAESPPLAPRGSYLRAQVAPFTNKEETVTKRGDGDSIAPHIALEVQVADNKIAKWGNQRIPYFTILRVSRGRRIQKGNVVKRGKQLMFFIVDSANVWYDSP